MEIEVISKECIKPSFPTPNHLKNFKLCLLDQLIPTPYAPIVFYYPMNHEHPNGGRLSELSRRKELLKSSLSETLSRFYPLAGKSKDELSIDCNDEGAFYVEARVGSSLDDFLVNVDYMLIHKFLPCEPFPQGSREGTYVTNIQVNTFECGGIAVGLCISHKIFDGASLGTFLKAWAESAQGCNITIHPDFSASRIFPTDHLWLQDLAMATWGSLFQIGNCVTKRFRFNASAISSLKAQVTSSAVAKPCPTKVEAVSAFLWKSFAVASKQKSGVSRPSLLSHVVNLRRRINVPEHTIGNLIWISSAKWIMRENNNEQDVTLLESLVDKVKESISIAIDENFVAKICGGGDAACDLRDIGEFGSRNGVDYFGFTSWCKLGLYDADFGWGKPIWVSSVGSSGPVFINLSILMETRCGEGIEAWVTLDEDQMRILQNDPELLALASLDPCPLQLDS